MLEKDVSLPTNRAFDIQLRASSGESMVSHKESLRGSTTASLTSRGTRTGSSVSSSGTLESLIPKDVKAHVERVSGARSLRFSRGVAM
jgi:hypothetical protein